LTYEPAREHGQVGPVGAALAADRAAQTVFFPVDQADPGCPGCVRKQGRYLVERALAPVRSSDGVEHGLREPCDARSPPHVEEKADESDSAAGIHELELGESRGDE